MLDRTLIAMKNMAVPVGEGAEARGRFERAAERFLGSGQAVAFWKGRIALYAILKAMGIGDGDEVIVPGYTCVMVPGPVIYAGATPVYVDIDAETYNQRVEEVERKITARTKAILVQHTYGFPAPIEEIRKIADARDIAVIEDCCHTFGGKLNGKMLGTFGAAAFFSGQWNKPFSTGLGGLALVQDEGLARKVRAEQAGYPRPGAKSAFMLASQILVYELFIYPRSTAMATEAFRWLTKRGIVVGSSSNAEFDRVIPENYALRPARVQCELAEREIARIDANMRHRVGVTRMYNEALPGMGYSIPKLSTDADVVTIRYPLRVANKDEAIAKAASHGVEIGSWFEVPLHPAETNMRSFGYEDGCCPVAERVCREVINLPTHRRMSESAARRTLEFVRKVCRPVK